MYGGKLDYVFLINRGLIMSLFFNKKNKVSKFFNPNSLKSVHELTFDASIDDIERWIKNGSLNASYLYKESLGELQIFQWVENATEKGRERLNLLIKYGFDINRSTKSGMNAAMSYVAKISPAWLLKQELEHTGEERYYLKSGFFEADFLFLLHQGLDFTKLDNNGFSVYHYAFDKVISDDINIYPDLLHICKILKNPLGVKPNIMDIIGLLCMPKQKIIPSTAKAILKEFYNTQELENIVNMIDKVKNQNIIDENRFLLLKDCIPRV